MKSFSRWNLVTPGRILGAIILTVAVSWAFSLGAIQQMASKSLVPHEFQFRWDRHLLTLHVVSDSVIFVSYLAISITLGVLVWRERREIPYRWMFLAFGTFIVACGFTHLLLVIVLWKPCYWFLGDVKLLTAVASMTTAVILPFLVPRLGNLLAHAKASRENEQRFLAASMFTESILAGSPFATIVTDLQGIVTSMNPAAEYMSGYDAVDLLHTGTPLILLEAGELARRAQELDHATGTKVRPGMDVLKLRPLAGEVEEAEWRLIRKDGSRADAQLTVSGLTDQSGAIVGLILIAYDITERKKTEEYIVHLAHHDALTGLPTRTLFNDRLDHALIRAKRARQKVAVLMVDLDHFKQVNDRLGHHAGDELLMEVAARLQKTVRASDTVARMGGDEFMVLLEDLHTLVDAERVAQKLLAALHEPVEISGDLLFPSSSIGICLYPDNGETAGMLLKNADAAMYQAKQDGRNSCHVFNEALESASSRRRLVEAGLHQALARDEMELVYQPQVSLATGMVDGVEALLRWRSKQLGTVSPAEFIPVAEESGLIVSVGEWVLRTACRQGRELQKMLGRDITIAVNISPRQFHQEQLPGKILQMLEESGLDPGTLELEITENILVSNSTKAMGVLEEVRSLGVRVAIDDFGTGFSSISYIMRFPVDRLKIDQSFVLEMLTDPNSTAVTTAVIALARGLNISVIAEGVELEAQRDLLRSQGCNEAQGYFYSKPIAMQEMLSVIESVERQMVTA